MTDKPISFAGAIRDLRKAGKMTQEEFAAHVGIARAHIGTYEKGTKPVGLKILLRISERTGVPLSRIVARAEMHTNRDI